MKENQHPLVNAVLYADIFNCALSKEEAYKYATAKVTKQDVDLFFVKPPRFIYSTGAYASLEERKELTEKRKRKIEISKEKIKKAESIVRFIGWIPSVKCIGISGAVAANNAEKNDDLDIFIITSEGAIWSTRLLVNVMCFLLGKKRKTNDSYPENKVCLNMFMTRDKMSLDEKRHDLYTAHEIVQLIPLVDKDDTYNAFLAANTWVTKYLPNTKMDQYKRYKMGITKYSIIEHIAKNVQLLYMKKKVTKEEITDKMLAFHPIDYRTKTLIEYEKRRRKYGTL
jgi:hypothetical protein